ncbi:ABC transporter substrate-binding protein [Phycicoccus endophyticus]|uniref:ABC transporter substrate-binding protein n=1 Tax=Phycicoccus endophyticus TaxID=1690220 RepID=A0A7G9QZQ3_9MICO|nr:ABC transporter substrate-binding protein [Phycicoccus endophyticus]NHI20021.1 ABC transporter substrate-binding protein [Phycicoccus endophyticus]QNN48828.1 ABC transporter substrate-binding protein [Phycicoccus endophyticus]GGL42538.1 hypothetical protein GCM10012283_26430 [Phycicoccus endophyticus]
MNLSRMRPTPGAALAVLALAGATALTAGCGSEASSSEPSGSSSAGSLFDQSAADLLPAEVKEAGEIHIASGPGYPPFLDVADDGTTLTGAEIEEMRLVGETLGVDIVFDDIKFDAVFPALQAHKTDAAAMALGVTAERLASVDFVSNYEGGTSLLVAAGNPQDITLDTMCGHTVAVLQGSVYTTVYLPKFTAACTDSGEPAIEVSTFKTSADAMLALGSGRVEATMTDLGPAVYQAEQSDGKLEALDVNYDPSTWGIAVPKGSELEKALQAALNSLIDNGAYLDNLEEFGMEAGAIDHSEIYTSPDQLDAQ